MIHLFSHRHHSLHRHLYIYLNGVLKLTIKNIDHMATLSITVEDNQTDLDAIKQQVADASAALTSAIEAGQTALAALQAFQINFTVSAPSVS